MLSLKKIFFQSDFITQKIVLVVLKSSVTKKDKKAHFGEIKNILRFPRLSAVDLTPSISWYVPCSVLHVLIS